MNNQNEETQILSQEEENLDSNDNPPIIVSGDTSNKNEEKNSNNITNNLNIEEKKKNIENNNEIQTEQTKQNPNFEKHYKHYGNGSEYQDNRSNFQEQNFQRTDVLFCLKECLNYLNNKFLSLFNGITMAIDNQISRSDIPEFAKRIIHTKQILLLLNLINTQYLLSSIDEIYFLNNLNRKSLILMIFSIIILYVHYYFFSHKQYFEKDEELEKFVLKRNPQLDKGRCGECHLIKICRSCHCEFCNKCVKKFQLHSDWFNICIGANNELLYSLTLCFTILYYFISNIIFWYYLLVRNDLLNNLAFIFTIFAILGIYIIFNSFKFLYSFIFENLFVNLTIYEKLFSRNLTYLWKDEKFSIFFNPFNKGLKRNIEEMIINLFDIDIYSDYKNNMNKNLSEIIVDEKLKIKEKEENNNSGNLSPFKIMIKLCEHFDPLITSKGNIYKFVDGKEIINWNRLIIFTPFDIINSPFKEIMIKYAKDMVKKKDKNIQNKKKIKKDGENSDKSENSEQIDSKENEINENNESNENI